MPTISGTPTTSGTVSAAVSTALSTGPRGKTASAYQESLFEVEPSRPAVPEDAGFRGPVACAAVDITYRQLDYWARTGLVVPSIRPATGSGTQRLYSFRDVLVLKIVKRLLDTGVSLANIRAAVEHLRARGVDDLATLTLMSDGASVYECTSEEEVIDLVRGGQGVFGIAVGKVWDEVEGRLLQLPTENLSAATPSESDELAARRSKRKAV